MTTPSRIISQATHNLAPIGTALTNCAAHLAYMKELLPQRGELVEEHAALETAIAWIINTYHDADEALLAAYEELEQLERQTREGWTPIPLHIPEKTTRA